MYIEKNKKEQSVTATIIPLNGSWLSLKKNM